MTALQDSGNTTDTHVSNKEAKAIFDAAEGLLMLAGVSTLKVRMNRIKWLKRIKKQFNTTYSHPTFNSKPEISAVAMEQQLVSPSNQKLNKAKRIYLQCDFCGKRNAKVRYHDALSSLNNKTATNFCRPDNRSKTSHCLTNYHKWITNFDLSKGLPHIVQRKYAKQLHLQNRSIDTECHYCGANKKTSAELTAVPTSIYNTGYSTLQTMRYQVFCKNNTCLKRFVQFVQNPLPGIPHIMKHINIVE